MFGFRLWFRCGCDVGGRFRSFGIFVVEVKSGVGFNVFGDGFDFCYLFDFGDDFLVFVEIMVRFVVGFVYLEVWVVRVVNVRLSGDSGNEKC